MNKEIAGVLAGLGISVGGIAALGVWNQSLPLPWWVFVLIVLALGYAAFTAGLAMERTRGPWVEVGPLELDGPLIQVFFVEVRNGPVPAKVTVKINQVVNSLGMRMIERSWEGHWRGQPTGYDGDLAEREVAQYGLLTVRRSPQGQRVLMIYSRQPEPGQPDEDIHTLVPISRDVREEPGVITLRVVVTCESKSGEKGRPQELEFRVVPVPDSFVGFNVPDGNPALIQRPTFIGPGARGTEGFAAPDRSQDQTPG